MDFGGRGRKRIETRELEICSLFYFDFDFEFEILGFFQFLAIFSNIFIIYG